jgi:hypothetical protein
MAYEGITKKYFSETHPKLRMLDNLIVLSAATFILQVGYGVLINRDPFNSFIAGVFCSMGSFGLSVSLRVQLTDMEFIHVARTKLMFEFCVGMLLLFFSCLLLMG